MNPEVSAVLRDNAQRLAQRIVPQLSGFDANGAAMIGLMLEMVAEEWDRAAARRVEENSAIRAIFWASRAVVTDAGLADRLQVLADGGDDDLRIAALDTANAALRAALTDLHAWVEADGTSAAAHLNETIWDELRQSVVRRHVSLANF